MTYEQRIKELLSVELIGEVLRVDIDNFLLINNSIKIYKRDFLDKEENLDTFCFKCIDYAFTLGFIINVGKDESGRANAEVSIFVNGLGYINKFNTSPETTQEAILKAINYVRENR